MDIVEVVSRDLVTRLLLCDSFGTDLIMMETLFSVKVCKIIKTLTILRSKNAMKL